MYVQENLAKFSGLAKKSAAARPMFDPESWQIYTTAKSKRFEQFIREAIHSITT